MLKNDSDILHFTVHFKNLNILVSSSYASIPKQGDEMW